MLVKLSSEMVTLLGAKNASDATEIISQLASQNSQRATSMATPDLTAQISALTDRIAALEKLFPNGSMPATVTEARVKEIVAADAKAILANEESKKIIGAEASRIFLEAGAATGTQPAKPSPAPAVADADAVANLIAQGKFAEAFAASETIRSEFVDAESYAGYMKALSGGQVKVRTSRNN